jgi:PAS domain S-box-containing protein
MPERIRVLYVDDEPDLLEVARLFLEQSPEFSVETAASAPQALNTPKIPSSDVIVSDYQMPGMDGIAFLKAVRDKYGDIPFILFTGRGREEVVIDAINNGADFYLQKGGDPTAQFAELAHKIRKAVSRRRSQEELKAAYEQITASEEELRGQYEELAQGERKVRESQELLRTFMDSATDAFSIWDADLNLVDMNLVALSYLPAGMKKEDLLGKNLQEFLAGDGDWRSIDRYREVQKTGIPISGTEKLVVSPSGTHWLNVKCFRVGNGLGIMTTDVTKEKEAEEKLRAAYEKLSASEEELRHQYEEIAAAQQKLMESQQQMTEIADTVPGVVYQSRFHPGGKEEFTFLSSRVQDVFSISANREDFTERFFAQVDPRDREPLARSISEAVAKRVPWEFEGRFLKPSGEMIWFQGLSRPVQKDSGLYYNGVLLDITGRKQAEEAVIDHAAKLREAQQMAHLGFWNWDIRTGNVEWSDEVYHIFGLDPATFHPTIDSILARSPWPEEQNRAKEIVQKATASHTPGSYEQRFLRPDNSIGYYYSTYQGRYDEDGRLTSMVGTVLDITSRKKAEMELRAGEDRYRSIIENAPYGMHFYMLDPERGLVFTGANPAADRILKVSHEQFVGKTMEEAFPGLLGTEIPWRYRNVAETGESWKIENTTYEEGTIRGAYDVTAFRTAPDAMAALFVDITERKKAEDELRKSEERLLLFIQQAPVALAMFDTEMHYLAASRRWIADYHLGDIAITGRSHYEIFPEISDDIRAIHRRALAGEVISSSEDRFIRGDGSVQWLAWEVRPWYTKGNAIGGIIIYSEDITEQKTAEVALREKTEELDQFFMASLDLFCIAGTDGTFRRLNPEWERALGYTLAELEGHRFLDFVHPDDLPATLAAVADLSHQKTVLNFTNRYRHKDGSYRWLEWRSLPKGDLIFAAARDITAHKEMEEALRESESRYRDLFGITKAVMLIIDPETMKITDANAAACQFYGYTREELRGMPISAINMLDTGDIRREMDRAASHEGLLFRFRHRKKNGEIRDVEVFSAPVMMEGRQFLHSIIQDITERRQMEEALRESEEKYRTLVEKASEGITIIQDGIHVYVNPRMAILTGVPVSGLMSRPFIDTVWPEDRDMLMDRYTRRMNAEDVPDSYDFRIAGPGGAPRWMSVSVAKIHWEGRPATLNMLTDVTERKFAEAALKEAGQKLALLNSVTRHDIRNQLTALQGFAQHAAKKEKDPEIAGFLARINANAATIHQQIEFMKTYQELGMNSPAWFRLDDTVRKICVMEVSCRNFCSGIEIFSDPMLEKVFSNLVDNAIRHGEHITEITIRCQEAGDSLTIFVEDNGAGIPDEDKEKIFLKGHGKNTGFGLFLVREILSITGIAIHETGISGKGARFEILVPKGCWRRTGT